MFQLRVAGPARIVGVDGDARPAQLREDGQQRGAIVRDDERVEAAAVRLRRFTLDRKQQPLDARAEADARRSRPADRLHQAVVAAAAADRRIHVFVRPDELERGSRVVVEPAHERWFEDVLDSVRVEVAPHGIEVLAAGAT